MKLFIISMLTFAAFANRYYPIETLNKFNDDSVTDTELKEVIFKTLDSYHRRMSGTNDVLCINKEGCYRQRKLNYGDAKKYLFGQLHLEREGKRYFVKDVYCRKIFDSNVKNIGSIGPNKVPNHQIVNCEHTWPQARFSRRHDSKLQKGDLHHLYPTDSKANSVRSSNDFGFVKGGKAPTVNCHASTATSRTYEPPHEHKGNVARAMFYFSVRYQIKMNDKMESALKQWHRQDPVDQEEMDRNDAIFDIQHNRNPFIDYPELVSKIRNF